MSKVRLALPSLLSFVTSTAFAQLEGTYRLISTTARILETGQEEKYADESGYITYGGDGPAVAVLVQGQGAKTVRARKHCQLQHAGQLFTMIAVYRGDQVFRKNA